MKLLDIMIRALKAIRGLKVGPPQGGPGFQIRLPPIEREIHIEVWPNDFRIAEGLKAAIREVLEELDFKYTYLTVLDVQIDELSYEGKARHMWRDRWRGWCHLILDMGTFLLNPMLVSSSGWTVWEIPRDLFSRERLMKVLYHELTKIRDEMNPDFGYPWVEEMRTRELVHAVWDVWINGRLYRFGYPALMSKEERLRRFLQKFKDSEETIDAFQKLWYGDFFDYNTIRDMALSLPKERAFITSPLFELAKLWRRLTGGG